MSNSKVVFCVLVVLLGIQDSCGGNTDNILGGSKVSLSSVCNFNSTIILSLKVIDGSFSSSFLSDSKIKGKSSFGLSSLFSFGEGFLDCNDFQGLNNGFISGNLLSFNLVNVIDNTDISVRDINDVVG